MKLILWWIFCFSLGFVTECQEKRYGLQGGSIHLSISHRNQSLPKDREWRFDKRLLVANTNGVNPYFEQKIRLNVSDWSLTIHNLQEKDSGLYEALYNWERTTLAAFTLTVERNVSKPLIKLNEKDFNSSTGECRSSVNCSADGSWAMFDCDKHLCKATQVFLSSVNITVTAPGDIHCHVNNHVSESHSQIPISCHEKQQRDLQPPSSFIFIIIPVSGGVLLGLLGGLAVFLKRRKCAKVHPQSSRVVIEQHHETVYCTVEKPEASQTSPVKNPTVSNKVETIYDTPSRHTKACQVDSTEVRSDNQEQQQSGQDRTIQVKATVHQAAEPESDPVNTIYCKLGEI